MEIGRSKIKSYFLYFVFYSIIGWMYEVFLEVVIYKWGFTNRGVLFGPYCPVYGFGALAFILTSYKLIEGKSLKYKLILMPLIFFSCMTIATVIELVTSYICELVMGYWPWQTYANYKINFQARIALSPSIRFGIGGIIFLYILQPIFEKVCQNINIKIYNAMFYMLLLIMSIDIILTAIK